LRQLWPSKRTWGYILVLGACWAIAMVAGWTAIANRIDNYVYDWMFQLLPPPPSAPQSIILAIDDATYDAIGGVTGYRAALADALDHLAAVSPKSVAVDLVLADAGDPAKNARLEAAMRQTRNLVLAAEETDRRWIDPLPEFRQSAAAIGHDKADDQSPDGVTRVIPLERRAANRRYWALALEAFRLSRGAKILESPDDLQIGSETIPARRSRDQNRPLRVLYEENIPRISLKSALDKPDLFTGIRDKTVFIGVTSLSATRDRVMTPVGEMAGPEVQAQVFETLARGRFLTDASDLSVLAICAAISIVAGLIFVWLAGWPAYLSGAALLVAAHAVPFFIFQQGVVLPYFAPFATAWLALSGAASYQHFVVRRELRQSQHEKSRYQQTLQWVTHEMRTPLTAIQGSSELIGRYNLSEEKRKEIAQMINSESKRLARMIQTFLDMERLSDGQLDLRRETFPAHDLVSTCVDRLKPLAERKNIRVSVDPEINGELTGDRELVEYAVYNVMTNAVKYSPPDTEISISSRTEKEQLRLSVKDQGIGMDAREMKNIFQKFYRTKRAEASGEKGTGIGLSIVEQIVHHHGGKIEVTSEVGKGSCFTMVLPVHSRAARIPVVPV
jgi:signal transduction histidine kinase